MHLNSYSVESTAGGTGASTVYVGPVHGSVVRVQYTLGTDTTRTFTITGDTTGCTVLPTQTAVTANTSYVVTATGTGASSSWAVGYPVAGENLKIVTSSGTDTKTVTFTVYVWGAG
jgi:hypothetical protein